MKKILIFIALFLFVWLQQTFADFWSFSQDWLVYDSVNNTLQLNWWVTFTDVAKFDRFALRTWYNWYHALMTKKTNWNKTTFIWTANYLGSYLNENFNYYEGIFIYDDNSKLCGDYWSYYFNFWTWIYQFTTWNCPAYTWKTEVLEWEWYVYNTLILAWPPELQIISTWSIVSYDDGVIISNFETNTDFTVDYFVNNVTTWEPLVLEKDNISYSGGVVNVSILNDSFYSFEYANDYELQIVFADPNNPLNFFFETYNFTYLPDVLGTPSIDSITAIQNWLEVVFTCDSQCDVNYTIYYNFCEPWTACSSLNGTMWTGGPWTFTGTILNTWTLSFNNYEDYLIDFTISDTLFPVVDYLFEESVIDYFFDPDPVVITPEDFTFSIYNVEYKSDGFIVNDFVPEPYGGILWFDIIAPNEAGTWTVNVDAWPFFRKSLNPLNWYWEDTEVNVDYPYHEYVGNYQMRFRYNWGEFQIYPYGTGYVNYYITEPQVFWYYETGDFTLEESVLTCDTNDDGELSTWEFLLCIPVTIKYYTRIVYNFFDNIRTLIKKLTGSFTYEVDTFSFIPWVHAEEQITLQGIMNNNVDDDLYKDTILWKFDRFFKWFIAFFILIIWLLVFTSLSKNRSWSK